MVRNGEVWSHNYSHKHTHTKPLRVNFVLGPISVSWSCLCRKDFGQCHPMCQGLSKARVREGCDSMWIRLDSSGVMPRAVLMNAFLSWSG